MWQHQAGRIDFDKPLLTLLRQGWRFWECASLVGAPPEGGSWAVCGVRGACRVCVEHPDRRDAWAGAVRHALMASNKPRPALAVRRSRTTVCAPDDPSACDEERTRLTQTGWSFSEHATVQESGRDGWVISGTKGQERVRAVDDDRSDAWGVALILAAVIGTAAPGASIETGAHDCAV
jgi:hypothetical protein